MKLVFAIISVDDSYQVIKSLIASNYAVTKLSTSGGFLRKKNITLMVGVENEAVSKVMEIIEEYSKSRKETVPFVNPGDTGMYPITTQTTQVLVGGATVFVVDVEQYKKL